MTKLMYNHGKVLFRLIKAFPVKFFVPSEQSLHQIIWLWKSLRNKIASLKMMMSSPKRDDNRACIMILWSYWWYLHDFWVYVPYSMIGGHKRGSDMKLFYCMFYEINKKLEALNGRKLIVDIVSIDEIVTCVIHYI